MSTINFRCTLSAAHNEPRETFVLSLDTKTGEVTGPIEAAGRLVHDDARVRDAARKDVFEAAQEALDAARESDEGVAVHPSIDDWERSCCEYDY